MRAFATIGVAIIKLAYKIIQRTVDAVCRRTGQTPPSSQDSNKVHELEEVVIIEREDISWSSFHQAPVVQTEVSKDDPITIVIAPIQDKSTALDFSSGVAPTEDSSLTKDIELITDGKNDKSRNAFKKPPVHNWMSRVKKSANDEVILPATTTIPLPSISTSSSSSSSTMLIFDRPLERSTCLKQEFCALPRRVSSPNRIRQAQNGLLQARRAIIAEKCKQQFQDPAAVAEQYTTMELKMSPLPDVHVRYFRWYQTYNFWRAMNIRWHFKAALRLQEDWLDKQYECALYRVEDQLERKSQFQDDAEFQLDRKPFLERCLIILP